MGHIRLGALPRTRKWIQVLDLIGGGAGAPEVAASAMEASQGGQSRPQGILGSMCPMCRVSRELLYYVNGWPEL